MRLAAWTLLLGGLAWPISIAAGQQVTVGTPYQSVGDSFFENMGTSWGLGGQNWRLNVFGSPTQAAPQFGGFDPSAGASFGFGFGGGGVNGSFLGNFSQGSRRSFTSQTPSVTLQNGYPGGIFDSSKSPFVISYVPVVGGFPTFGSLVPTGPRPTETQEGSLEGSSVVRQALKQIDRQRAVQDAGNVGRIELPRPQVAIAPPIPQQKATADNDLILSGGGAADDGDSDNSAAGPSSAARPAISVAEARRLHQAEQAVQDDEVAEYIERAQNAESAGKSGVAKIYYKMAERRASGPVLQQIQSRLRKLEGTP